MRVRLLLREDAAAAAAALSDGFAEDPLMTWLLGLADRTATMSALRRVMFEPAVRAGRRGGNSFVLFDPLTDTVVGAALWAPPGTTFFGPADGTVIREELVAAAGTEALERLQTLNEVLVDHHHLPGVGPAFHLQFLGLGSGYRGRGLGGPLLLPVLARCDADGLAATLESSNPRNLTFYRALGFEAVWEDRPPGGPLLTGMLRAPRPG